MRRVTCLVALAAVVALALPSGGRATVMQVAQPVPDFNHDGFGDLAVGAPGEDVGRRSDAGAISVLYGRATGMSSDRRVITQDTPGVAGFAEPGDQFGAALVAGRFNGDVFWDLAVGAPGEDVGRDRDAGAVTILYGSDRGLRTGRRLPLTQPNPEPGDRFGFSLAVGEISGTARAELVVGAPGETIRRARSAGAVNVIDNPAGTSPSQRVLYQGKGMSGSPERDDNFGWDVVANDFMTTAITGGRDSLAVGVPGEDVGRTVDAGAVNIRYAAASPGRRLLYQDRPERGDRFGTALGDGLFGQANGTVNLAVGAPGETVRGRRAAGAVSVVKNNNSGFQAGSQVFYQGRGGGVGGMPEAGDRFGAAVAVGEGRGLGGVALGGLAVGVPGEDVGRAADAGFLTLLYGLGDVQHQFTQKEAGGRVEAGDRFGEALWAPFRLNPGLHEDLGVGSPGETVNGQAGAGAFSVLIGTASSRLPTGQTFYQGPRSRTLLTVGGTPEAGDALGAAFSGRPRAPARPGRRPPPPPPV
jgi:hypothetical protein